MVVFYINIRYDWNMKKLSAEQYRKLANEAFQRQEDSWERSDTDGFLSQWASGLTSQLNSRLAELAEAGWVAPFPGLFSVATGERIPAKIIMVNDRFRHGKRAVWALVDPATDRFTGTFVPVGENSRKQKQLGFVEKTEMAPAFAKLEGSNACNVSVWVYRTDGGYPKGN